MKPFSRQVLCNASSLTLKPRLLHTNLKNAPIFTIIPSTAFNYTKSPKNKANKMAKQTAAQFKKALASNSEFIPGMKKLSVYETPKSKKAKAKSKASETKLQDADNITKSKSNPTQIPSAASGGIPSPTPSYLSQSATPPLLLHDPRRILVIMDLNGTLLYRPIKRRPFHFVERPHAQRFLNYCISNFTVAIWSSARPQNVHKMLEKLLAPELREKCVVIWGRDKLGLSPEDYDMKVQVYKRLTRIWQDPAVKASHPDAHNGGVWDQMNTVLMDDSMEKGRSEPHNILVLPEFAGLHGEIPNVLPQVHDYLNALCYQGNISAFMRREPFTLDPTYTLDPA